MTADAFSEDVKKARLAGMNEHLAKPITLDKLRESLEYCRYLEAVNNRQALFEHKLSE